MNRKLSREEIKLRCDFVKGQKYTLRDLKAEIEANHFATAHRLIHTLKGLAGLINERALSEVSLVIERQLKNKQVPNRTDIDFLDRELARVLNDIIESGIMDDEPLNSPPTIDEQIEIFNKLQHLLEESDAACLELIGELSLIPETKVLVRQIEHFSFKPALATLNVLRDILGY